MGEREAYVSNMAEYWAELERAEAPILADLEAVGIEVTSVWFLDGDTSGYPVLATHLRRGGYPDRVMAGMAQAFARKEGGPYWDLLAELYRTVSPTSEFASALADALGRTARKEQVDDLVRFVCDPGRGESRIILLRPLSRLGGERARALMESFVDDPVLGLEASDIVLKRRRR